MSIRCLFLYILFSLSFTGCGVGVEKSIERTVVCIIGTEHNPTQYINPDTLMGVLLSVGPDAVFCELEQQFFTAANTFDMENYPDLLSTNENIAAYRYNQEYGVPLYPYEIEGRNEYYRQTDHFGKLHAMFNEMGDAFQKGGLSPESEAEWKIMMDAIPTFDVFGVSLREINTPLKVGYSEVKNILTYETLISVAERDFPKWVDMARENLAFWERRNDAMAENIISQCGKHAGDVIVVLCGQQHKAPLVSRLRNRDWIELREYWEFANL